MTKSKTMRWATTTAVTLALAAPAAAPAQQDPMRGLDDYVREAVHAWQVPGLAIAVVKGDEVVFSRGYGVRKLGDPGKVDEHTILSSGSTTKAFTTTALAMLVDEGKLDWDDRVVDVLPGFQLYSPHVTREVTVRDLITHRTGQARGDLLWYGSENDREDIVELLRYQEPASSFRSAYAYNNNMFAVAGEVVEAVSGQTWAKFVRRRILEPLGMDRTLMLIAEMPRYDNNIAQPHDVVDGELQPVEYRDLDNIGPAGSMMTSVQDMTRWLRFHLADGQVDGRRLLSEEAHQEMFTPQTVVRADSYYPAAELAGANFRAYGLGWFLQDYRGHKLVMHTGSIDGMSAITAMLPEEDVGMVVFINRDHSELRHALMYRVLDAYIGGSQRDWSAELFTLFARQEAQADSARAAREARRVTGTAPSLPLSGYTGVYSHPMYGELEIREEGGVLAARRGPQWVGPLERWHYNTFRVDWNDPALGETLLTFELDAMGEAARVRVEGAGEFERVEKPAAAGAVP
jgi:CubicO group peptidase (beta-lactamase class C family)